MIIGQKNYFIVTTYRALQTRVDTTTAYGHLSRLADRTLTRKMCDSDLPEHKSRAFIRRLLRSKAKSMTDMLMKHLTNDLLQSANLTPNNISGDMINTMLAYTFLTTVLVAVSLKFVNDAANNPTTMATIQHTNQLIDTCTPFFM